MNISLFFLSISFPFLFYKNLMKDLDNIGLYSSKSMVGLNRPVGPFKPFNWICVFSRFTLRETRNLYIQYVKNIDSFIYIYIQFYAYLKIKTFYNN